MAPQQEVENAYAAGLSELTARLDVDITKGLSDAEAARRLAHAGPNELEARKTYSPFLLFIRQFKNAIVLLLLAAAIISFLFGDHIETIAIVLVILINAIIGFILELQARRSMESLRKLDRQVTRVLRNGQLAELDIRKIVPGDILFVEAGDMVAADARLGMAVNLEVNESMLTGESLPVVKNASDADGQRVIAEQENMLFRGTFITRGNAYAVVTATGMSTEMGRISEMVMEADKGEVPLNRKLNRLSRKLIWLTLGIIFVFVLLGLRSDAPLYQIIETAIALAVAAIPEGLPIVATIALAHGMLKMARKNVLIKKLAAVETLGETDLIMTDKTGTLTENKLEVILTESPSGGQQRTENGTGFPEELVRSAMLCNNAILDEDGKGVGDPLEVALLEFVAGSHAEISKEKDEWQKIDEQPFESESRIMITVHSRKGVTLRSLKGGPSEVLKACSRLKKNGSELPLNDTLRGEWIDKTEKLAAEGYKVLGFAYAETGEFIFAGLAALSDPPRDDVRDAIRECHEAGIDVVMVTGDHAATALAIGKEVGLIPENENEVVNGADLLKHGNRIPEEFTGGHIFSRVSPAQKLALMTWYQEKNLVVAMTGDGVNDAPALRKSDIGIAMGIRGTQVAREAADMILQDDSFSAIVGAIEQGRVIINNIRHFVVYLISCNLTEILVVSAGAFLSVPLPLIPLQILFLNLVTDVFPALALGMGGMTGVLMKGKFRGSGQPLLDSARWRTIAGYSFILTLSVMGAYLYSIFVLHATDREANNIAFYTLAFGQLVHPFSLIRGDQPFLRNEIVRNKHLWLAILFCTILLISVNFLPGIRHALGLYHLTTSEIWLIIAGSLAPLPVIRLSKVLFRSKSV